MDINEVAYTFNKVMIAKGKKAKCIAYVENGNCVISSDAGKIVILTYDGLVCRLPGSNRHRAVKAFVIELSGYYSPLPRRNY